MYIAQVAPTGLSTMFVLRGGHQDTVRCIEWDCEVCLPCGWCLSLMALFRTRCLFEGGTVLDLPPTWMVLTPRERPHRPALHASSSSMPYISPSAFHFILALSPSPSRALSSRTHQPGVIVTGGEDGKICRWTYY